MKILNELQKAFPDCWFKPGADFDGGTAAVWSGEGGEVDNDYAFDFHNYDWDFGVHPRLNEFVKARGYFWEAYDAGTYMLYKD